ncbi:MAG: hypothetical protein AABW41_00020 [Nanoarchaeota archaeon]
MKPRFLNSIFGKDRKGIVFTLDVMLGIMVVLIILTFGSVYLSLASDEKLGQLQLIRTGNDILAILDYKAILQSQNETLIYNEMKTMLPPNMDMQILIEAPSSATQTTMQPPPKGLIVSGSRVIYINGNYAKAKYLAWYR